MDNLKYIPAARMRAAKHSHRNLLAMLRMSTLLKKRQRVKLYIYSRPFRGAHAPDLVLRN